MNFTNSIPVVHQDSKFYYFEVPQVVSLGSRQVEWHVYKLHLGLCTLRCVISLLLDGECCHSGCTTPEDFLTSTLLCPHLFESHAVSEPLSN